MLRCVIAVTVAFTFVTGAACAAQTAERPQKPDYANSFSLLGPDGALKPLERKPVGVGAKVQAFGLGGVDGTYQIQDEQSTVRLAATRPSRSSSGWRSRTWTWQPWWSSTR